MIRIHDLTKRYPGATRLALDAVSLSVEAGELAFVCGPSGAGKTTLLRILAGLERPTSGQILVGGRNLAHISPRRLARLRRRLGFVFQDFRLLDDRSVLDNVTLPLSVRGVSAATARPRALDELERVGLEERADARPHALSAGEKQRAAIARALVGEPALVLADEPTGNLDPELAARVLEGFVHIQARGTAVLVATHDPRLVEGLRRPVHRLEQGRVAGPGSRPAGAAA